MNEFQPGAEQEILFLFVATGKGSLFALPQFIAELAIMTSIYGCARQIGNSPRAAACTALAFATLSLVALESTTAQNDLVTSSFPVAAAALLLAGGSAEVILAGMAIALGGRRQVDHRSRSACSLHSRDRTRSKDGAPACCRHRSRLRSRRGLGLRAEPRPHWTSLRTRGRPSAVAGITVVPRKLRDGVRAAPPILLRLLWIRSVNDQRTDASRTRLSRRHTSIPRAQRKRSDGLGAGLTGRLAAAPALIESVATWRPELVRAIHLPGHDSATFLFPGIDTSADVDASAFGPLAIAVLGVSGFTLVQAIRRRSDTARLALALSLPVFIVLLALQAKPNPWIARFLVVPVALTMPLLGAAFRRRDATFALSLLAVVTLALTHWQNTEKPIGGSRVIRA